jgi:toxin YhaV
VSPAERETLVVNGWLIVAHPLFLDALEDLTAQVEKLAEKDPVGYGQKKVTKRLAAIRKLAFEDIPADPASPAFRQGSTLGAEHSHWFRAKFFQQYRLFFRYHQASRVIVLAWVNDDDKAPAGKKVISPSSYCLCPLCAGTGEQACWSCKGTGQVVGAAG